MVKLDNKKKKLKVNHERRKNGKIDSKFGVFSCNRAGVSNTRPAGRMWPARCVCATRDIIKITQIIAETTLFVV